jgi:hypothetical protein
MQRQQQGDQLNDTDAASDDLSSQGCIAHVSTRVGRCGPAHEQIPFAPTPYVFGPMHTPRICPC